VPNPDGRCRVSYLVGASWTSWACCRRHRCCFSSYCSFRQMGTFDDTNFPCCFLCVSCHPSDLGYDLIQEKSRRTLFYKGARRTSPLPSPIKPRQNSPWKAGLQQFTKLHLTKFRPPRNVVAAKNKGRGTTKEHVQQTPAFGALHAFLHPLRSCAARLGGCSCRCDLPCPDLITSTRRSNGRKTDKPCSAP